MGHRRLTPAYDYKRAHKPKVVWVSNAAEMRHVACVRALVFGESQGVHLDRKQQRLVCLPQSAPSDENLTIQYFCTPEEAEEELWQKKKRS